MKTITKQYNALTPTGIQTDWITLTAFGIMVVLIGTNFVAVRFSNLGLPPFWGAGIRFGAASLIFLFMLAYAVTRCPGGAPWLVQFFLVFCSTVCFMPWLTTRLLKCQPG